MQWSNFKKAVELVDKQVTDDTEVYVTADHGQDLESADALEVRLAERDGKELFTVHPDDVDEQGVYETVVVVYGD